MKRGLAFLLLCAPLLLCALSACADPRAMERQARELVFEKLSTPQMGVVVGPVVQQSKFAVVDWTRGGLEGGRILLRRDGGDWTMVLCGGAPMKRRPVLQKAGVPDGTAGVLVTKLLREESRIDDARRAQVERWKGLGVQVACPEAKES